MVTGSSMLFTSSLDWSDRENMPVSVMSNLVQFAGSAPTAMFSANTMTMTITLASRL